jgi:hypothetical protein
MCPSDRAFCCRTVRPSDRAFWHDNSVAEPVRASVRDHWTQRKVTVDAEESDEKKKSDGGRREKWRDDRRMESFRGSETQVLRAKYRGPETQVLRARSWNLALRAWNPGPDSVRALLIGWSN